jgi:hypothetical protein
MSEQRIEAGAAASTRDDEARADAATPTDADTQTAGEESVRAAHAAAAGEGADTGGNQDGVPRRSTDDLLETDSDLVPSESDRS